jgi:sporulation protein YlmC with PRC-barrel domain
MRWSEAKGRQVVSTSDASTVGKVSGIVVDARLRRVVGVVLKKTDGEGDTLLWPDITAFGTDAVTVAGRHAVTVADETTQALRGKEAAVLGKRVLSTEGDDLGKVKDLDFDAETGVVNTMMVGGAEVSGTRLVAAGSYAVVVRA